MIWVVNFYEFKWIVSTVSFTEHIFQSFVDDLFNYEKKTRIKFNNSFKWRKKTWLDVVKIKDQMCTPSIFLFSTPFLSSRARSRKKELSGLKTLMSHFLTSHVTGTEKKKDLSLSLFAFVLFFKLFSSLLLSMLS